MSGRSANSKLNFKFNLILKINYYYYYINIKKITFIKLFFYSNKKIELKIHFCFNLDIEIRPASRSKLYE